VGCSTGALAAAYRRLHPNCNYTGIEIDANYAEIARNNCNKVFVGDIEELLKHQSHLINLRADGYVFGDCLEHLYDPWCVLKILKGLIPKTGWICACIPNMQYYGVQAKLNRGEIFYEDNGPLDRTHIRWFTKKTITHLFESSGFTIEYIRPIHVPNKQDELGVKLAANMAKFQGRDPQQAAIDALAFQYVLRARPIDN